MPARVELPQKPKPPTDPQKQWKTVVRAVDVVKRVEQLAVASRRSASQENGHRKVCAIGCPEPKFKQNQPPELDLPRPVDSVKRAEDALQSQLQEDSHVVLNITHRAIVERLKMDGVVLTLLGSVSFMTMLQPPGGFDDNGNQRSTILVTCFMFFSTLSFLFTFIGLFAVVVGCASLFRPAFFLKFERFRLSSTGNAQSGSSHHSSESGSLAGSPSSLLYNAEDIDDLTILAKVLWDNLERTWRLRVYLIMSLIFTVCAFGCGAFAIVVPEHHSIYLLAGAISVGLVALVIEVIKTVTGVNTYYKSKWLYTLKTHYPNADLPLQTNSPGEKFVNWMDGVVHPSGSAASAPRRSNLGPVNV